MLLEVEMVGGLPFATTQTATFTRLGVPDGIDRGTTKLEILSNDVPRETFRLSGYGLPEPKFKQGLIGMWVWYLIAGIVCFGASGIIVKRRRAQG